MNLVRKEFKFCYAHQLFDSYTVLCQGLHGHNAKLEIFLTSNELDFTGMVIDFTKVKDIFKSLIDDVYDHSLLLPIALQIEKPEYVEALIENNIRVHIWPSNPTAENMAKMFYTELSKLLNRNSIFDVRIYGIRVWETDSGYAEYIPGDN